MIYEVFKFRNELLPFKYFEEVKLSENIYLHWHEEIELICVTEGEGYGFNNSVKTSLKTGDILVVNSGEVHSFGSQDSMSYHCIIISESFLRKNGIDITKVNFCHHIRNKDMENIFNEISDLFSKKDRFTELHLRTLVLELFCKMSELYIADTSTLPYYNTQIINGVKGAINYIHENYNEKITIDEILMKSGFSRAYFSREFKKITGKSIVDYINYIRCTHAEELIASRECSIRESAEMCGFSSMSYFSKTYRKFIGNLPSETIEKNN